MPRILIAPLSFDAALSCKDAAETIRDGVAQAAPDCTFDLLPLSTGGRGTLDALEYTRGGERRACRTIAADERPCTVEYLLLPDGLAVIEAASMLGEAFCGQRSPGGLTSYGLGSVAADAIRDGAEHILFALGDTRCIDGGSGVARAFGVYFLRMDGSGFLPCGATLDELYYLDRSEMRELDARCLCDVDDTLFGEHGAAARYAREVGCYPDQMPRLEQNLRHLHGLVHPNVLSETGDGAAGGVAYALRTLFGAALMNGTSSMLHYLDFDAHAQNADLILTAVSRIWDHPQSSGFLQALVSRAGGVPVAALCGGVDSDFDAARLGLSHTETVFSGKEKTAEAKRQKLFQAAARFAEAHLQ